MTGVELIPVNPAGLMINPRTGAVISDTAGDDDLIDFLEFLRDTRQLVDDLDGDVSEWLRARADVRGKWTLDGGRASMPSNRPGTAWDETLLKRTLDDLLIEGKIDEADHQLCVVHTPTVIVSSVNALIGRALPDVVVRLQACKVVKPVGARKVKVNTRKVKPAPKPEPEPEVEAE